MARGVYEPGAWIRANLSPQRCDLSPDGRWFCYFTLKMPGRWKAGHTYVAIARLPWLTALAAWGTCGTWARGAHFVEDPRVWGVGAPDEGDAGPCRGKFGLALTRPATFAVERRRGWTETADTPPRVRGYFAAFRESRAKAVAYELITGEQVSALDEAQWADWDADGRLLVATRDARLQIRELSERGSRLLSEANPGAETPRPAAPPPEALR